jgi:outer membrane scaffolding protein for murein synthesis (MipA/OmpV family)
VPLPGILTAGVDLVTTLPGGHETTTVSPSLGWVSPVTDRMTVIGSLGSQWGTEANMSTFFGVSADADRNVQAYQPKAGLRDLSLSVIAAYRHTERWSTIWLVSASRYQGDAARSPLVQETISLHRLFFVWGLSYRWSFE